jgi:hypothetical protein
MKQERKGHNVVLLKDAKVLITGGTNTTESHKSAEIINLHSLLHTK